MNIPQVHKLSRASQLSLLAIVILLGAVFFPVNSALQEQNGASHASGSNILSNPGCESGTTGFTGIGATISTVSSPVHSGNTSCRVASTGVTSYYDITARDAYPNPQAGQTFTGYAYVRADSNTGGRVYVAMQEYNGSTLVKSTYGTPVSLTTNWQLVNNTTIFPSSGTSVDIYIVQDPGSGGQTFYADDMFFSSGVAVPGPTFAPTIQPTLAPTATPVPTAIPTRVPTSTPVPTIRPTVVPTGYPTPFPTSTPRPTATPVPTQIPQPTDTPVPGNTTFSFTLGLHGVGSGGDSANPNSIGNTNPRRPSRTITADIYDAQNQLVVSQQGDVTYNASTGKFIGNMDLGDNFATGLYTVKVKTDQYLRALDPGIQTITQGQTKSLPTVTLVAGDVNGDNQINIIDYNLLIGCYSDLLPAVDCTPENNVLTDLNDDGSVNAFDYNLFLRELTNIGGQ
jgi:hypothetical protein